MSEFCSLLQSTSKLYSPCLTVVVCCSLLVFFCSLLVSISLLGYVPSFLGEFSHDTIVVAPSLSFPNVVKSSHLVLFSWRKLQKNKKKCSAFQNLLPHISTMGAPQKIIQPDSGSYSAGLQVLFFLPFLVIGHVTTLSMTYWMDSDRQNHPCVVFLHFFIKLD